MVQLSKCSRCDGCQMLSMTLLAKAVTVEPDREAQGAAECTEFVHTGCPAACTKSLVRTVIPHIFSKDDPKLQKNLEAHACLVGPSTQEPMSSFTGSPLQCLSGPARTHMLWGLSNCACYGPITCHSIICPQYSKPKAPSFKHKLVRRTFTQKFRLLWS